MTHNYRPGLEVFLEDYTHLVANKRVGLITNHTGLDNRMVANIDLFSHNPGIDLVALFGPEHGVRGNITAGEEVSSSIDSRTGLPVFSLYGKHKTPPGKKLEQLDVLLFDLQDAGTRFYTYLSTLIYALKACAERGLPLIVLDRPNPLGRKVEGNLLQEEFQSFVGAAPVLLRHGLTLGEMALLINSRLAVPAPLRVIPCQGWKGGFFRGPEGKWVPPSPGLPHFATALAYPGTCLFEGTNLSEGRGTAKPFEYIGAPWIDPYRWREKLLEEELAGVDFRPVFFYPRYSRYSGEECGGLQIFITDPEIVDTVKTTLVMLYTCRELFPGEAGWISRGGAYFFDLLLGSSEPRLLLEKGAHPREFVNNWVQDQEFFGREKEEFLLYHNWGEG